MDEAIDYFISGAVVAVIAAVSYISGAVFHNRRAARKAGDRTKDSERARRELEESTGRTGEILQKVRKQKLKD